MEAQSQPAPPLEPADLGGASDARTLEANDVLGSIAVEWSPATRLDTSDAFDAFDNVAIEVATDASGNALVVWQHQNQASSEVMLTSIPAGGQPAVARVLSDPQADATRPRLALSALGEGTVVWTQRGSAFQEVWGARLSASDGASSARRIDQAPHDAEFPGVAIDAEGGSTAVWQQVEGTSYGIWTTRLDGAQPPTRLDHDARMTAQRPALSVTTDGTRWAAWYQSDGSHFTIQGVSGAGTTWSDARPLGGIASAEADADSYDEVSPRLSPSRASRTVLLWERVRGQRIELWVRDLGPYAASPFPPARLPTGSETPQGGVVAASEGSDLLAAWIDPGPSDTVAAARWSDAPRSAEMLESLGEHESAPAVAEASGFAAAAWLRESPTESVVAMSVARRGSSFAVPVMAAQGAAFSVRYPRISISENGNGILAWEQRNNGHFHIWARTFHVR